VLLCKKCGDHILPTADLKEYELDYSESVYIYLFDCMISADPDRQMALSAAMLSNSHSSLRVDLLC